MNERMQQCIQECTRCHKVCLETLTGHCLSMGGEHVEAGHVKLMMDCVQICATSADFLMRGSERHVLTCGVCAQICDACAKSCERMDSPEMKQCTEVCYRCAATCRTMAEEAM